MDLELRHLWNGAPAPDGVGGRVTLQSSGGVLALEWELALPGKARIPASPPGFTEGLWEWDVVELFLRSGPDRYLELELGPGGHWLALTFRGVRQRSAELRDLRPGLKNELSAGLWRGRAEVPLELAGPRPWTGLVTAVLGSGAGRLYLSWPPLPGVQPDFHQPQAWAALEIG